MKRGKAKAGITMMELRRGKPAGNKPNFLGRLFGELGTQAKDFALLMRLDRPIGIWLLLWPTLWALWIVKLWRRSLKASPQPGRLSQQLTLVE